MSTEKLYFGICDFKIVQNKIIILELGNAFLSSFETPFSQGIDYHDQINKLAISRRPSYYIIKSSPHTVEDIKRNMRYMRYLGEDYISNEITTSNLVADKLPSDINDATLLVEGIKLFGSANYIQFLHQISEFMKLKSSSPLVIAAWDFMNLVTTDKAILADILQKTNCTSCPLTSLVTKEEIEKLVVDDNEIYLIKPTNSTTARGIIACQGDKVKELLKKIFNKELLGWQFKNELKNSSFKSSYEYYLHEDLFLTGVLVQKFVSGIKDPEVLDFEVTGRAVYSIEVSSEGFPKFEVLGLFKESALKPRQSNDIMITPEQIFGETVHRSGADISFSNATELSSQLSQLFDPIINFIEKTKLKNYIIDCVKDNDERFIEYLFLEALKRFPIDEIDNAFYEQLESLIISKNSPFLFDLWQKFLFMRVMSFYLNKFQVLHQDKLSLVYLLKSFGIALTSPLDSKIEVIFSELIEKMTVVAPNEFLQYLFFFLSEPSTIGDILVSAPTSNDEEYYNKILKNLDMRIDKDLVKNWFFQYIIIVAAYEKKHDDYFKSVKRSPFIGRFLFENYEQLSTEGKQKFVKSLGSIQEFQKWLISCGMSAYQPNNVLEFSKLI